MFFYTYLCIEVYLKSLSVEKFKKIQIVIYGCFEELKSIGCFEVVLRLFSMVVFNLFLLG